MQGKRYDQRVLVLVEVRGGQRDWDEAERAFGERDWPVVTSFARGEGSSGGVLRGDPSARLYSVEVRFFGARNRRTARAAVWPVERLARVKRLEMYARRCEPMDRDREQLTVWWAHGVDHRPPRVPAPRPSTPMAKLRRAAAVTRARFTERRGYHDTGTVVTGTASEARRLSRMGLLGAPAPASATDVRVASRATGGHIVPHREDDARRKAYRLGARLLAMGFCAVVAREQSGVRTWVWAGAAVLFFLAGARLARGFFVSEARTGGFVVWSLAAASSLAVFLGTDAGGGRDWTPRGMLLVFAVLATAVGIWLLVRQWTWGEWLTWAVPLVFAAVASLVVSSGSVLHAMYADSLDLMPADLDVPAIWQAVSAVKLMVLLSSVLVVPALWGIAKHVHVPGVSPVDRFRVPLYVVAQATVVVLCVAGVLDSVGAAVGDFRQAAARKAELPSYFGVEPEWTCIEPTVPAAKLGTRGGVLRPERPYVSFGEAGGAVSLWDEPTGKSLQMPAEQVRLVPVADGSVRCTFSYESLPKGD
ncbi:NnrS multi-domain protein [Streptomyces sp. ZAF1911]|uniref:NnrS multi-domain protein n=1 Tax=Streptomyces sp. ZAF1911 TaxID=2944129 RepID=UPI00237A8E3F|nr:NnrS multi-domain protein [Streptomyces sp. ZAF1911]MDD9379455.1 NnrS multi-domain protein [Streptomyces sp. ZAF1911]